MIEGFVYGMFYGKIRQFKTDGVDLVISDRNFERLKKLPISATGKCLWLPTEQVIALPLVKPVSDRDGREWIQNRTLLVPIHDYLNLSKADQIIPHYFSSVFKEIDSCLEALKNENATIASTVSVK